MPPTPVSINRYFFKQTNNLHKEIISLHDFVLPAATALWNFRKLIEKEFREDLLTKASKLSSKYNTAPGTRASTNLIIPFRTHTWDNQRERLAEISLINIIALFEAWCEDICEIFGRPELAVKLQFPTNQTSTAGIRFAISAMQLQRSVALSGSIYLVLSSSEKYSLLNLDNLLKCYRYFKEIRNCLMHRGRKCDGKLWGAQSEFGPVANISSLGMDFIPEHQIFNQGDEVHLSFHGVLGFTEVILRIVTTVDAELSATPEGEVMIVRRISEHLPIPFKQRKLKSLFTTMGWPLLQLTPDLLSFLKNSNVTI